MRTLLTFAPALLCAGTMFFCFRMMAGKHGSSGAADHDQAPASRGNQAAPPEEAQSLPAFAEGGTDPSSSRAPS